MYIVSVTAFILIGAIAISIGVGMEKFGDFLEAYFENKCKGKKKRGK